MAYRMQSIAHSEEYMTQLQQLVEPAESLRKHGFIMQPLSDEELLLKRRCQGCGKAMSQLKGRVRKATLNLAGPAHDALRATSSLSTGAQPESQPEPKEPKENAAQAPRYRCKFHPGEVFQKYWTCCDQYCTADPCSGSEIHDPRDETLSELSRRYQLYPTPISRPSGPSGQTGKNRARGGAKGNEIRAAVALDCEMGMAESGDSELIKVTLVDYFTGEILVDNIVEPDVPLRHLNTRYSGVTWGELRQARRKRTTLDATPGARFAIWKFVGPQTIVVGHGVNNDLRSMKWIHENVVDSLVIEGNIKRHREEKEKQAEAEAIAKAKADGTYVEPVKEEPVGEGANAAAVLAVKKPRKRKGGDLSLKTLADKRLGRKIQLGEGTTGHDSLEDAVAARDLVHWHICNPGTE